MKNPEWNDLLVQFGIGAFETMRWSDGKIPLLPWHRQRLQRAIQRWGLKENSLDEIWSTIEQTIAVNHPTADLLRVKLLIGLDEKEQLFHHVYAIPFQVNTGSRTLFYCDQVTFKKQLYKSCQYEDHYLNLKLAHSNGYDDVIYLDAEEKVLECRTAAVLFSQGDQLCAIQGPTLASSSIQSLLDRYPKDVIPHAPIKVTDLPSDTHWFTCNALQGIWPVANMQTSSRRHIELPMAPAETLKFWNDRLFHPI